MIRDDSAAATSRDDNFSAAFSLFRSREYPERSLKCFASIPTAVGLASEPFVASKVGFSVASATQHLLVKSAFTMPPQSPPLWP